MPKVYTVDNFMSLDIDTRRNLELCENMIDKGKRGTLLSVLDYFVYPFVLHNLGVFLNPSHTPFNHFFES